MPLKYPAKCGADRCNEPLIKAVLAQFEEEIGTRFPEDYRDFLLEWNGVVFRLLDDSMQCAVYQSQPVHDHSTHTHDWKDWNPVGERFGRGLDRVESLIELFGLHDDKEGMGLKGARHSFEFEKWSDRRFLPIGHLTYYINGFVCISLSGADRGHIYDWTHPLDFPDPEEVLESMENMSWLSPSFREFWDVLRPMTQEEWESWGG